MPLYVNNNSLSAEINKLKTIIEAIAHRVKIKLNKMKLKYNRIKI